MATIERREYKSGPGWRVIWYSNGDRKTVRCSTEDRAREFKALIEHHKGDGDKAGAAMAARDNKCPKLSEVAEHHFTRLNTAPYTVQTYRGHVRNHIAPAMGALPVNRLTDDDIRSFIGKLEAKGLAHKTVTHIVGTLAGILDHAVKRGWINASPYNHGMLPKVGVEDDFDKFLDRDEVELIIPRVRKVHQDAMRFLLATGLRPSEMRALNVEDIHLKAAQPIARVSKAMKQDREKGEYIGTPKSKVSVRTVGLPPSTVEMIRERVESNPRGTPLFVGSTGKRLDGKSIRASWANAVDAAQALKTGPLLKDPSMYSLRHTHASWMLAAGMQTFHLAKHLGHSVEMTETIYGHLLPEAYYQAAMYAEQALGGSHTPHQLPQ